MKLKNLGEEKSFRCMDGKRTANDHNNSAWGFGSCEQKSDQEQSNTNNEMQQ